MPTASIAGIATYADNPFHGPTPLREGDPIFGRDREIKLLRDQLLSDRLVLLHAISGCGKTSLVEAGLRPLLRKSFNEFPTINVTCTADELASANVLLGKIAHSIAPDLALPMPGDTSDVTPLLIRALSNDSYAASAATRQGRKSDFNFLFFDQFETSLSDRKMSEPERVSFFKSLGLLLEGRGTWALFAIREDYLGDLQPYLRFLPTQLSSRFRLTRFSVDDAALAIEMKEKAPYQQGEEAVTRIAFTPEAARSLAEDMGKSEGFAESAKVVEPVHLQVVCEYLWEENKPGPISTEQLGHLKDGQRQVTTALREYYKTIVGSLAGKDEDLEFRVRLWFEHSLIDKEERRIKVGVPRDSREITTPQLDFLIDKYLIRDDQQGAPTSDRVVELAHDSLIVPIIRENREWFGNYRQPWLETAVAYARDRSEVLLLCGDELKKAREWSLRNEGKLEDIHKDFLRACLNQEKRQRDKRRLTIMLTGAIVVAIMFGIIAFITSHNAHITSRNAQARMRAAEARALDALNLTESAKTYADQQKAEMKMQWLELQERIRESEEKSRYREELAQRNLAVVQNELHDSKTELQNAKFSSGVANIKVNLANDTIASAGLDEKIASNSAELSRHEGNALQAVSEANENSDLDPLNQAVFALKEAQLAGDLALAKPSKDGSSVNLLQRAEMATDKVLSRMLLKDRLCIRGYIQSFAPLDNSIRTIAVDQAGFKYDNTITTTCPKDPPSEPQPLVKFPKASAVAEGRGQRLYVAAVGTRKGVIKVSENGDESWRSIDLKEPIVALNLSRNGEYLGASSALWSVSVWRLSDNGAIRVLRWPGSLWNPASWLKWLAIVRSTTNQLTNTVAIHLEESANGVRVGLLAAGQDDGRIKIVPVNSIAHRNTKPMAMLGSEEDQSIVAVRFSPSGQLLATGSRDGTVRLWDLSKNSKAWKDGEDAGASWLVTDSSSEKWCGGSVTSLEFVENVSQMLAVGCQDATVHIYDIRNPKFGSNQKPDQLEMFRGSPEGAKILVFDPSTKLLYATGPSPYVEVWKIPTPSVFVSLGGLHRDLDDLYMQAGQVANAIELNDRITKIVGAICEWKQLAACNAN